MLFSEDDQSGSWWKGEVLQGKGDFFLVSFYDDLETVAREIVERERLRPAYGHNLAIFEKVLIPIKCELQVCFFNFVSCVRERLNLFRRMSSSRRGRWLKWPSWCHAFPNFRHGAELMIFWNRRIYLRCDCQRVGIN